MNHEFIYWPHTKKNNLPLATIENLKTLLDVYNITLRYDAARKDVEIHIPGTRNRDAYITLISLLNQHRFPKSHLRGYLKRLARYDG